MSRESRPRKVSHLVSEGKLSIGDGYRAKNSELSRSGLPFARAGNIDGGFNFEDADCFPERQRASFAQEGVERAALQELHHEERHPCGRHGVVVHHDDVRMAHAGEGLCFQAQAIHERGIAGERRREQLDRHLASKDPVLGLEHLPHGTGADAPKGSVSRAGERIHFQSSR